MAKSDLPDAAAREAALDPGRSFIVQAPAGSGKTELLVRRFLKLLATVERPEEILAITFTRKAAAEMRKRVLEATPEAKELGHRLRIQTIDALCASLTRQMPVLARFGAQPDLVEDARPHYREAALRTLKDLSPDGRAAPRAPRQQPRHRRVAPLFDARQARPVAAHHRRGAFPRQARGELRARARAHPRRRAQGPPGRVGGDGPESA